jgi:pantetheine-phosphate adenylyltransferase
MSQSSRLAVVAGSFDPPTNGHIDLVERAVRLFDRVVVAVLTNLSKQPLFTVDERLAMLRDLTSSLATVEVDTFDGLLADYVARRGAVAVVRGVRTAGEFSDEWSIALANRHLNPAFDTVLVVPSASTMHVSSRVVREIASFGGPVDGLVPPVVAARLATKYARRS